MKKSAAFALLERLANEQRHVLSRWRALILLRRATFAIPAHERRWEQLPQYEDDLSPLLRQMTRRGEIAPVSGIKRLFEITVPYAQQGFVDEREILFEVHPYAVLSHLSALVFHGLTGEQPKGMTATVSTDVTGGLLPIGTGPRDWEGVSRPAASAPARIFESSVTWLKIRPERFFGFEEYQPLGVPLRYTTLERTLIDGLQQPELCGGIAHVLSAWRLARDRIDLDVLLHQIERYGVAILRQRAGYVLEQIALPHPLLDEWRATSHRGGSSRLVGAEPFSSLFDERWNLSLNAPVDVLREDTP